MSFTFYVGCVALNVSAIYFRKKKKKKDSKLKKQGKGEKAHASAKSNETNVNTPVEKHNEEAETTPYLNNVSHSKDGHDGKLSNNE